MNITFNFECKTDYVSKDGTIPLSLRICINRKNNYLKLGRRIKLEHYDAANKKVKSGINGYTQITSFIKRQEVRVDTIITDLEKQGQEITFKKIETIYKGDTGKTPALDFYEYVKEAIQYERDNTDISDDTLDNYCNQLDKLQKYCPKLTVYQLTVEFIEKYLHYIKYTLKHSDNSVFHAKVFLRKYLLRLHKKGLVKEYPFTEIKVGKPHLANVEYLEPEEITRLHDLYESKSLLDHVKKASSKHARDFHVGERYQSTLQHFLTACYCGLRHSDIKTLARSHVKEGFIVKQMKKGRLGKHKTVRIPVRKRLHSLFNWENSLGLLFENPVQENGTTNNYLKEIMQLAGINKHITFHCARHTFAITSLILGIKLEVVSDILGHSEISTTQRYARIVDRLREKEMNKWDQLVKEELGNCVRVTCPDCDEVVFEYKSGLFVSGNFTLSCQSCSHQFLYQV
jgi:site-specific recombinase XerD